MKETLFGIPVQFQSLEKQMEEIGAHPHGWYIPRGGQNEDIRYVTNRSQIPGRVEASVFYREGEEVRNSYQLKGEGPTTHFIHTHGVPDSFAGNIPVRYEVETPGDDTG